MEDAKIISEMKAYLMGFVEKPHQAFGNLPVCPFAKKARIENKLIYKVMDLEVFDVLSQVALWQLDPREGEALIFVHPSRELSWEEYSDRSLILQNCLDVMEGLSLFLAHPDSDFMEHGVYTRREPYANWQMMSTVDLDRSQAQLRHSKWYNSVT